MSKNAVPAIIGILFTMVQAFLPLSDTAVSLNDRVILALCFSVLWILYAFFAGPIENWILRSCLGKHTQKRTSKEKIDYFHNTIVNLAVSLYEVKVDENTDFFVRNVHYNNWCEVIDFILMDCCCTGDIIDNSVVTSRSQRYAGSQRHRSIDVLYLKSIVDVLYKFKGNKQFEAEVDSRTYYKHLDTIKRIVDSEVNKIY